MDSELLLEFLELYQLLKVLGSEIEFVKEFEFVFQFVKG